MPILIWMTSGSTSLKDNIDAADRWISKLFDAFEAVGRTPGIGHKREDLADYAVLFFPVGEYLIIYRTIRGTVEIIAVTQGSRDIPTFLRRRVSFQNRMRKSGGDNREE